MIVTNYLLEESSLLFKTIEHTLVSFSNYITKTKNLVFDDVKLDEVALKEALIDLIGSVHQIRKALSLIGFSFFLTLYNFFLFSFY